MARAVAAGVPAGESAAALLDRLDLDAGAREAIRSRVEVSCASAADRVPAAALAGFAHMGGDAAPSIAGGNQRLALGLAADLGLALRLASPARALTWDERGVRVALDDGAVEADACVIAAPATTVSGLVFEPALPPAQADALEAIRYGHAAKLFVPLHAPATPSAVLSVPERYWAWTAIGDRDEAQPVVSAFAGSPEALERLRVSEGPATWLDSLARLRPDLGLDRSAAVISTWDDDPWARAAYSVPPDAAM